jgi:hypothetical protein
MIRILRFAATATSLIGTGATAAAQSRGRQAQPALSSRAAYAQLSKRRRGPTWAMPNECHIDEGFGRFSPCR